MAPPGARRLAVETGVVGAAAAAIAAKAWGMASTHGLTTPVSLNGDGLFHASLVSSMQRHGWYFHDPDLGWPVGRHLADFPLGTDHLHLALLKLLSLLPVGPFTVANLFFLLSFALVAAATHGVLRAMGLHRDTAAVAGLLFAFAQYHAFRSTGHLFLSNYVALPLFLLLVHRLVRGELLHRRMGRGAVVGTGACVVVLGSASPYYAAFAAVLLVVAGITEAVRRRERAPALAAVAVVAAIGAVFLLNLAPTIVHDLAHGTNVEPAARSTSDADVFGLRLASLVAPVNHRFPPLQHLGEAVARVSEVGEGGTYVGLFAAGGLAALVGLALLRATGRQTPHGPFVGTLSVLTVVALLLATKGGGSLLLANLGASQIRGWNRMAIVLALFGLTAAALGFDRRARPRLPGRWATAALVAVLVVGLLDQIPRGVREPVAAVDAAVAEATAFVRAMEAELPEGAAVHQLPYVRFPGSATIVALEDYQHLLLPLVGTGRLRWSYGAMRGRGGDWQEVLEGLEPDDLAAALVVAGFAAVEVDRRGYADGGAALDAALGPAAGAAGPFRWYDLRASAPPSLDGADVDDVRAGLTRPPQLAWVRGAERGDFSLAPPSRLAGAEVVLEVRNRDDEPREVRLVGRVEADGAVTVEVGGEVTEVRGSRVDVALIAAPGRTEVVLRLDGPRISGAGDTRDLRGRLSGFVLVDRRTEPLWEALDVPIAQLGRPAAP